MATTTKKVSVTSTSSASLLNSTGFDNYTWTEANTAGINTFIVDKATKTGALTLRGTGDTLKIDGYSGDFTASISGSKLTLIGTSSSGVTQTLKVTLPAATTTKATFNLSFTDGAQHVDYVKGSAAALINGTHSATLTAVALPVYGQTAHEAAALTAAAAAQTVAVAAAKVAALTDTAGHPYGSLDAAIISNDTAAISAAVSTATGNTFTTVADLLAAYNAFAHPTFSIAAAASATEGTNATFTVSLSAPQSTAAKVNLVVTPTGDATAADFDFSHITIPTGFTLANNVLTFPLGVTTGTISIPVVADSISPETGEGLSIALTATTGSVATVNAAKAAGTVNVIDVPPSIIAISPTNATATATAASDTFNVAAGNYTASIAGFGTGDSLVFAPSTVTSVTNTSGADGNLTVTGSLNNQVVTINLTGISAALDAQIIDTASFVSVFAPVGPATTNSISPTATTATATTGPDTFNIAAGNYSASIAGFGAKDKLVFAAGSVEAITNTSGTDGNITVTGSLNNQLVTIQLTGVSATLDSHVFDAASFNTAFGTGSLV